MKTNSITILTDFHLLTYPIEEIDPLVSCCSSPLPTLHEHKMSNILEDLIIFTGIGENPRDVIGKNQTPLRSKDQFLSQNEMELILIEHPDDYKKISFGLKSKFVPQVQNSFSKNNPSKFSKWIPLRRETNNPDYITKRKAFTLTKINDFQFYLFGGSESRNSIMGTDDLYLITFMKKKADYKVVKIKKPSKSDNLINEWPKPRFGHCAENINGNLLIFGGQFGKFGGFYNDLFLFNSSTNVFSEIKIDSTIPPPLSKAACFHVNISNIFLFGGVNENGIQNNNYVYG